MNTTKAIRTLLGISQADMARALGCTQSNVSFYERRGQSMPIERSIRLIEYAKTRGVRLTAGQVYGLEPIASVSAEQANSSRETA